MSSAAAPEGRSRANEAAGEVGSLFARHGRTVYGICRAMLRDVHEAEDATQQVFLSAHKALLGGVGVRDAGGWLATIARNECRARIAAGMRRPLPVADADLDAVPDTGDEHARHARREELRAALAELPERQREAVVLRYLYGLRYREVATALGLSRPATEALLFRARRALRASLRPVAGTVISVPVAVREQLALALPGFEERAAPVVVGAGVAGGVIAKLAAGGAGVKVATATVAVATVGAVGTVGSDRPAVPRSGAAVEQRAAVDLPASRDDTDAGDRSGPGGGSDDAVRADDDRSGSGSGKDGEERERSGDDSGPGSSDTEREPSEPAGDRSGPSGGGDETTDTDDRSGPSGSGSSSSGAVGSDSSGSGGPDGETVESGELGDSSGSSGSGSPDGNEGTSGSD